MRASHLFILLLMNFCWGAVYSAYKVLAPDLPATGSIVTLRFGLAAPFLLILWPFLPGPAPRGLDLFKTCAMGVLLYSIGQRLQVYGNQLGSAANSSVLIALEPVITSLAAALFLREHIGPRRLAGFLLGLTGVMILNRVWRSDFTMAALAGSLFFVASFVFEAAYSIIGKPIVLRASAVKMLAISLLAGTGANLLVDGPRTIALAQRLPWTAWLLLGAIALVCTAIGYTVWFVVIRECPVNVAALTIFAQSVFGMAIAAVWLKESLGWEQFLGTLTIVSGLGLGLSRQIRKPSPITATSEPAAGQQAK